ncbi:MAG: sodium/proline symporter PutP [Ruminococcus sp.]|nr:sodium/proline symporter PutP [Ruminococcus sp.]
MNTNLICILITIIAYLGVMIAVGIVFSKKNNNVGDFYLGGRKLGPLVTAMSAEASDMSSWLLMGLPGVAYLSGASEAGWTAIGLAVGTYLNWLIVAKRLRVYSHRCRNSITIPDFFSNRYRDDKRILMGISALIILIFFIPYTASGFAACGKLFNSLFDINYHTAMIIAAVVIISYTSIGGFLAASTTDLMQSIVMTIALIILVCFGVHTAGGFSVVADNAESLKGYFSLISSHNSETGESSPYSFLSIVSTLAWGLGYFGMPHILLRFMAIEDKQKVKTSRRIASVWVVISMAVAIFIGFIGNALSVNGSISQLNGSSEAETVVIKMAELMSENGILPALLAGLIFAGILACTMSTSDSQLLAASSSMSENIIGGVFRIKLSQKMSMIVARGVLVVIALISIIIAWNPDSSVFEIVSFAWAGFGATFGPVMLTALFWKRSNKSGALAGMVTGGIMVFAWKFGISKLGGAFAIYELLPAFIAASIAIVVVSLVTAPPSKEITEEYEAVAKEIA